MMKLSMNLLNTMCFSALLVVTCYSVAVSASTTPLPVDKPEPLKEYHRLDPDPPIIKKPIIGK